MPYVAIKSYPRSKEEAMKAAEKIEKVLAEEWKIPPEYVTVSFEAVKPEDWDAEVAEKDIRPNMDKMLIVDGKKQFQE